MTRDNSLSVEWAVEGNSTPTAFKNTKEFANKFSKRRGNNSTPPSSESQTNSKPSMFIKPKGKSKSPTITTKSKSHKEKLENFQNGKLTQKPSEQS